MFKNYVLMGSRLTECVVRGALELGLVPAEVANAALANLQAVSFEQVENGGILGIDSELVAGATAEPAPARREPSRTGRHSGNLAADLEHSNAPDVEKVKQALAGVMTRCPSLGSIKAWSSVDRRKALKWAKAALTNPAEPRPDFIKEPAVRGSRGNGSEAPAATAAGNGASSVTPRPTAPRVDEDDDDDKGTGPGPAEQFFSQDDESAAGGGA